MQKTRGDQNADRSEASPKSPSRRAYRPRIGEVMVGVATHIALSGPSYPSAIARAIDAQDGSTWKAVVRLDELGILEEVPAEEGPRCYRLSRAGWWELERMLLPRDGWNLELANARMHAFEEEENDPTKVRSRLTRNR